MIREWLEEYKPANAAQAEQGLREILQEIALAGLQRSGFFENAAFYGGTALRIFYGLDRYSEDLDFSLLKVDSAFSMEPYLKGMVAELESLGVKVSVRAKNKTAVTAVDSAFLKPDTVWKELVLHNVIPQEQLRMRPEIKIKIEVDTAPPLGFATEEKLLLRPFAFYTKCFSLPDLFAGKMHAVLFRKWKNRVKGRDWYDMEWYIRKGVPLHLDHLVARAKGSGNWEGDTMSKDQLIQLLENKIESVSFKSIREDVIRFIRNERTIEIWSPTYFRELIQHMRFQ